MKCGELYSDYLLATCGYATATGLSAITDGEIGHDSVKSIGCAGGVLVVDDTISH